MTSSPSTISASASSSISPFPAQNSVNTELLNSAINSILTSKIKYPSKSMTQISRSKIEVSQFEFFAPSLDKAPYFVAPQELMPSLEIDDEGINSNKIYLSSFTYSKQLNTSKSNININRHNMLFSDDSDDDQQEILTISNNINKKRKNPYLNSQKQHKKRRRLNIETKYISSLSPQKNNELNINLNKPLKRRVFRKKKSLYQQRKKKQFAKRTGGKINVSENKLKMKMEINENEDEDEAVIKWCWNVVNNKKNKKHKENEKIKISDNINGIHIHDAHKQSRISRRTRRAKKIQQSYNNKIIKEYDNLKKTSIIKNGESFDVICLD